MGFRDDDRLFALFKDDFVRYWVSARETAWYRIGHRLRVAFARAHRVYQSDAYQRRIEGTPLGLSASRQVDVVAQPRAVGVLR